MAGNHRRPCNIPSHPFSFGVPKKVTDVLAIGLESQESNLESNASNRNSNASNLESNSSNLESNNSNLESNNSNPNSNLESNPNS